MFPGYVRVFFDLLSERSESFDIEAHPTCSFHDMIDHLILALKLALGDVSGGPILKIDQKSTQHESANKLKKDEI